jgi:hypothetical protein
MRLEPAPRSVSSAMAKSAAMAEKGWTAVALDDVEAVAWQGTELTWRRLRRAG